MSIYRGRRYDDSRINTLKFNNKEFLKEVQNFKNYKKNNPSILLQVDCFFNYSVLLIINNWRQKFINKMISDKLIDILDGYYFAYTQGLISKESFFLKIEKEILTEIYEVEI